MIKIEFAKSATDIERCFQTMVELRTHLSKREFMERAKRQIQECLYHLVFLEDENHVKAVAGFRISECLAWGKFMYVDDLVTNSTDRSKGFGGVLFDWLVEYAKSQDCDELHLDSGVQRFDAHRFYLKKRMDIASHHFRHNLRDDETKKL